MAIPKLPSQLNPNQYAGIDFNLYRPAGQQSSQYKYKVATPDDLVMGPYGGIKNAELQGNKLKYADYINQKIAKKDWQGVAGNDEEYWRKLQRELVPLEQEQYSNQLGSKGFQDEAFRPVRNQILGDLASQRRNLTSSLASRGIEGGATAGEQAKLAAQTSGLLATGRQDVANAANQQAQDIKNNLVNFGLKKQQIQQNMFNAVYNSALSDYQNKMASGQAIAGAVGMGAGIVAGLPLGAPGVIAGAQLGQQAGKAIY